MKQLQKTFVMNADKCGNHTFTQIRREGNVAAYRRNRVSDGSIHTYEVFLVKTVRAGAGLPGGGTVKEDYEQYPGASAFGRHAWSISCGSTGLARVNHVFDCLLKNIDPDTKEAVLPVVEIEGEEIVTVARVSKGEVKFQPPPEGWKGTQKELASFLGFENYKKAWTPLQKWLGSGILKVIGENQATRGKSAKVFGRA